MYTHSRIQSLFYISREILRKLANWTKYALSSLIADLDTKPIWGPESIPEYIEINRDLKGLAGKSSTSNSEHERLSINLFQPFADTITGRRFKIFSVLPYQDQVVKDLIFQLKFSGNFTATRVASAILLLAMQEIIRSNSPPYPSKTLIVPALASKKRKREKGFDQCQNIATTISRLDPSLILNTDSRVISILSRKSRLFNVRQLTLARKQRFDNVGSRFQVDITEVGAPSTDKTLIIVFDDVTTTGATLIEAMKTIRSACPDNNIEVIGLSLAH